MKLKKSPSPYVSVHKNCSGCRAIMLFVSADTHYHEKVFRNLLHHCLSPRKFLRHTNSKVSHKTVMFWIFWTFEPKNAQNDAKSIVLWLTFDKFVCSKNFLGLRQWCNKFLNTSSWSWVPAETNSMIARHPKQFLWTET